MASRSKNGTARGLLQRSVFVTGCRLLLTASLYVLATTVFAETRWRGEWPRTDFDKRTVALEEIESGGPPKDGIPAIDRPRFVTPKEAGRWLDAREPVIVLERNGDARAYPLQILIYHEIVNDTVGGLPVAVTFCPLCNASIVFDRRVGGAVLDFGTTGKLRKSDLVMYDRQSESWWQQFTGKGIVGRYAGTTLTPLPSTIAPFSEFTSAYPGGRVLHFEQRAGRIIDRDTGSEWDLFGRATAGPLKGVRLRPADSGVHFAFAWLAFNPATEVHAVPGAETIIRGTAAKDGSGSR